MTSLTGDIHSQRQDIPMVRLEEKLRQTLTPKYMDLFQQIGKVEGGVKFLVDLRGQMMVPNTAGSLMLRHRHHWCITYRE